MPVIHLGWDSEFFGFKVGKIELQDLKLESIDQDINRAGELGFSLLYLFGPAGVPLSAAWQVKNNCHLVDTKVIFARSGLGRKTAGRSTRLQGRERIEQLYDLAYESGKYSRFRIDPRFGLDRFRKLYRAWVDNSISRKIADDIFVSGKRGELSGFCTVKYLGDRATIGLIAVSPEHQGKGIGRDLYETVEFESIRRGCRTILVATQAANEGACRFYEKMGMTLAESTDIYHLWLNTNDTFQ